MSRSLAAVARARAEYCARRQRLLGEPELSQLRRLCDGWRLSFRLRQAARTGQRPALRRDVRGGSVVAVPPPDHRGLPTRRRRAGVSHSWAESCLASEFDEGRHADA